MKRIFIIATIIIPLFSFSQENSKIDSLQRKINILQERIDSLKNEIQEDILRDGYSVIAKSYYSYSQSTIKMKDREYGTVIDTISIGDSIRIIDKTLGGFKVLFKGKTGYIGTYDIDITEYPVLNYLVYSYLRETKKLNRSSYSTGASVGGSVNVKGYYRKDGTYVRPHTRSSPKSRGGRRR
ncbi:MAG: hypothetical protein Q4G63_08885 [Bacteroidia bacterium]|nr:hypothetical protein [Bacteroidia bacterium]